MRVRQLYGTRAGEIVEMPYHIAVRAIANGTVELELARPVVAPRLPAVTAVATAPKRPARPPTRR